MTMTNTTSETGHDTANGHGTGDWGIMHMALLERAKMLQPGNGGAVDALIAEVVTSPVPDTVFKSIADAIAKATGLDGTKLKKQMEAARAALEHSLERTEKTPEECEARRAEAYSKCRHIAEDPEFMFNFIKDVQDQGVEGEAGAIVALKLTHVSRLLDRPASMLRKGAASSGKNQVCGAVLHFSNEGDDWISVTAGSARSLVYLTDGFQHKTLYIPEAAGIATKSNGDEDPMGFMIRTLLSENCIKYLTVEEQKDPATGRTRKVGAMKHQPGPTNAIITTARENVEDEMATRLLVSYSDESEVRTRSVIKRVFAPASKPSDDRVEQWRALETWLRLGPKKVVIPFGNVLIDMISTRQLRMRRDAASLRALIEASALLHQAQRDRDGEAIVASLNDYAWAVVGISDGLDAIAAGSEVDTAAVAKSLGLLLRADQKRFVRHEAAQGLAARLVAQSLSSPPSMITPTLKALTRLSASSTATYAKVKAVAAKGGLTISTRDLREVMATAALRSPTTVRIGGRKLAQSMGITYKIARVRLQRAIEDGVVIDETPSNEPRHNPLGRVLRPGNSVTPLPRLKHAIPSYDELEAAIERQGAGV